MIYSLEFKDFKKAHHAYFKDVSLPTKIEFKEGTNILVGINGSGKSTVLNILKHYTLINDFSSDITLATDLKFWQEYVDYGSNEFYDGIEVKANYGVKTYNYRLHSDIKGDESLENILNFNQMISGNSLSDGQKNIQSFNLLFNEMFGEDSNIAMGLEQLQKLKEGCNDIWKSRIDQLVKYFKNNNIDDNIVSLLMDEPDRNMDLENTKMVYNILSNYREDTQIICAIHNPVLIYKLAQLNSKTINFIELTKNYIKDIINFVNQ